MSLRSLLIILIVSVIFYSCGSRGSNPDRNSENTSQEVDGSETFAEISIDEDFVDLGTIKHGEVIAYTFNFKNTGNKSLLVLNIIPGCGCTSTKLSKKVLKPSEEAFLEVVFDSKGWYGSQFKSVTIVTNATTPKRSVTLKVNIVN
jgi:hypothetical protein